MTEKERFVHLALSGKFAISELCDQHGISRKTGHKYINRYKAQGRKGVTKGSVQNGTDFRLPFDILTDV